ncbi:MAG: D-3-phosphoglycerate dehydrogenase [uncultured Chloroflexi bacterium]|uniref:D-3-phosphoglycerate dehydrogenase n=1 Tax=uncultured Chloroflexota bacterium TaxID=166587 RepID=A0A6J4J9F3_9CHLR|nr:MAG: D-3-phosphoglycerate dehydrogenase [uncultured Chloroflexota bacterium]
MGTQSDGEQLRFCFALDRARLTQCFRPEAVDEIARLVDLDRNVPDTLTDDWLRPRLEGVDGVISGWGSPALTEERLAGAPKLRYALHSAGSVKSMVTEAVWRRGIRVTSAANVNGRPVAQFVLGLLFACLKDVFRFQEDFRQRGRAAWRRGPEVAGYYRTTLGIIGAGNVGRQLLRLLQPHDFRVLVYDPHLSEEGAQAYGAATAGMDTLLQESRAVVLVAPNIPENRHMIAAAQLALLQHGAYFINVARGALVDHDALIAELQRGRITACLDVADPEPPPEGSPLYTLSNCILTPHVAGSLNDECLRLGDQVLEEVRRLVAGQPFDNEVTEEALTRMG